MQTATEEDNRNINRKYTQKFANPNLGSLKIIKIQILAFGSESKNGLLPTTYYPGIPGQY
jgi:hypothetical protein